MLGFNTRYIHAILHALSAVNQPFCSLLAQLGQFTITEEYRFSYQTELNREYFAFFIGCIRYLFWKRGFNFGLFHVRRKLLAMT